jgi:hypothetical protein
MLSIRSRYPSSEDYFVRNTCVSLISRSTDPNPIIRANSLLNLARILQYQSEESELVGFTIERSGVYF